MFKVFALLCSVCIGAHASADVGHLATPEEQRVWKAPPLPDGRDLPAGSGTVGQGVVVFARRCSMCHGVRGEGKNPLGPPLVGGIGSLTSSSPLLTVGSYWPYAVSVWDYIQRAMPYPAPGSLTSNEVYALTAFLLAANGIVPDTTRLDAHNLSKVRMPNAAGFIPDPRPDVISGKDTVIRK
jgi:S-disulfanyl-L-cysteine oxidoreductase SoxD